MYLTEYQKLTIDNFMGLFNRGSLDDVPPDHASDISNMAFARKREVLTRPAATFSKNFPGGNVVRQFLAAFNDNTLIPLACDGVGNIWRLDNYTVLLSLQGMIDFEALNMNNHVYIAPIWDPFVPLNYDNYIIYVWAGPFKTPRPAAGLRPAGLISAVSAGSGNTGPGYYGVAISYVFDTGYVSPPSDVATVNMPGGTSLQINNLPPLPVGATGYIVFATKAQDNTQDALRAALFEVQTVIPSPGQTSVAVNFFDTDLVILASADPANGNLFNSMPRLPSGISGTGSIALIKYHGRMIIIGPKVIYDPKTGHGSVVFDGRIFISHSGAPENFDNLTGYLVIQAEFDGNAPRTGFELLGTLYICKAVGTFATFDNGSEPLDPSTPWTVNLIDGGIGAYHHSVGTITGSQPSLSFNSTAFLANRNGLFIFNGNVLRPELTWKIRAIWQTMTLGREPQVRLTIDIFNDIFYIFMPTDLPAPLGPNLILMGDYSLGLDSNNIRWSIYTFPWPVYDIVMAEWEDTVGITYYYLRLGSVGNIYKLDGSQTYDETWSNGNYVGPTAINCYYQSSPFVIGDMGALNIFRFIRYRMAGRGTVYTSLMDQGEINTQLAVNTSPDPFPGNYRDIGFQINFTNEKMIVRFGMNFISDYLRMARFDVFGKLRWPTRPNG